MSIDYERIRRVLLEHQVLEDLAHSHTVYEADEDHGGFSDGEITEDHRREASDLEYVLNWLQPGYISPAFPDIEAANG